MAENQLVVKLALKAAGYKQEIKSINNNTKLLKSEFDKAGKGSKNFENTLDGQRAKLKLNTGELENAKKKLNIYQGELTNCEKVLNETSQAFTKQQNEVMQLKSKLDAAKLTYGETSTEVKTLESELAAAEKVLQNKRRSVIAADTSLTNMQTTINKVETEIGKLENEIQDTNKKIYNFENGIDDVEDSLDEFGKATSEATEDALEFGENMAQIGEGVMIVGEAVGEAGNKIIDSLRGSVESSNEFQKTLNDIRAKTGLAADKLEELSEVINGVYNNNFGESWQDVGESVALVNKILWLTGEELQRATEKSLGLRDVFGYDVAESVRSVDALMKHFGMNSDEAFNLIVQGAQQGLDFSGELLDSINEYSVQFAKAGLSAEDMFNILYDGTQTGAWNLDKIGDAVKEFNIRLTDGSNTTAEALNMLGMDSEKVANTMSKGGDKAKETYIKIIEKLTDMDDKQKQNLIGVGLFGTMWEDLGPTVVGSLAEIGDNFNKTIESADEMNNIKYDDLQSGLAGIGRNIETGIIQPIGNALLPALNNLMPSLQGIIDNIKNWIAENPKLTSAIVMITGIIGVLLTILGPLIIIIGLMVISIGAISTALTAAGGAAAFFTATILPIVAVIGSVIAVAFILYQSIKANWEGIQDATNTLIEACKPYFEQFKESFSNLWATCKSIYDTVIAPLFKIIGEIIAECIHFVTPILKLLATIFSAAFNNVSTVWNSVGKPVFNFIMSIVKQVWSIVQPILRNISSLFSSMCSAISSVYNNILRPVFEFLMNIVRKVGSIVGPIFREVRDTVTGCMKAILSPISWVIDKLGKLYDTISNVGSKIGGFLSKLNPFKSVDMGVDMNVNGEGLEGVEKRDFALSGSYYTTTTLKTNDIVGTMKGIERKAKGMTQGNNFNVDGLEKILSSAILLGLEQMKLGVEVNIGNEAVYQGAYKYTVKKLNREFKRR